MQSLVNDYGDYKTQQEYGRSAFWIWVDAIKSSTLEIDSLRTHTPYKGHYSHQLGIWGYAIYDIVRINGNIIFYVYDYSFNQQNFYKWLHHETIDSPIISNAYTSVTNSGIDGIEIVKSDANTYNWRNIKTHRILCNQWYLQIGKFNSQGITYVQLKDDQFKFINSQFKYIDNNIYRCIGTTPKGNFYVQLPNGNYCLLNPDCTRKDRNLWRDVTIQNGIFKGLNGNVWNVVESRRFSQIITETINSFIAEDTIRKGGVHISDENKMLAKIHPSEMDETGWEEISFSYLPKKDREKEHQRYLRYARKYKKPNMGHWMNGHYI